MYMHIHYTKQHIHCARMNSGVLGAGGSGLRLLIQQYINPLCYISVSSYFVIVGYTYMGLYMVSGIATVLFLRETHTCC